MQDRIQGGFEKLIDDPIIKLHMPDPVLVPSIQLGGLDPGHGLAQGTMGA